MVSILLMIMWNAVNSNHIEDKVYLKSGYERENYYDLEVLVKPLIYVNNQTHKYEVVNIYDINSKTSFLKVRTYHLGTDGYVNFENYPIHSTSNACQVCSTQLTVEMREKLNRSFDFKDSAEIKYELLKYFINILVLIYFFFILNRPIYRYVLFCCISLFIYDIVNLYFL